MAKYCVTVFRDRVCRDDSDPSVFGSARVGGVCVLPVTSGTEETHTLSSYGISSNQAMSSIFQLFPATSLNKFIVEIFSDDNISMLSSKQGPIIPKKIYKSEPAFSNCKVLWIMSLLGIMIFIGYQSEMGSESMHGKRRGVSIILHSYILQGIAFQSQPTASILSLPDIFYRRR